MWHLFKHIIASVMLLLLVIGCTDAKNDTYLRFTIEGKQYHVGDIAFSFVALRSANRHFIRIGQDHMRSESSYQQRPDGAIQWIMESINLEELQGKEIHFSEIEKAARANRFAVPTVVFTSEQDSLSVYSPLTPGGNMVITLVRINGEYAEGSFSGAEFADVSLPANLARTVQITGSFKARLIRSHL